MPKEELYGPQVPRAPVNQGGFGSTQGMCAVLGRVQPELGHPGLHDSRVLAGGDVRGVVNPAREEIILVLQMGFANPGFHDLSRLRRELELNGSAGLLLDDGGPLDRSPAADDISDLEAHEITASEFAVYCQVEESELARIALKLEADTNSPDLGEF